MSWFAEGWRMMRRAARIRKEGFRRYAGDADAICKSIIDECYTDGFFRVSAGHFCEFYVRDFAFIATPLLELGYGERVRSTVRYALERFAKAGKITTTIDPDGNPFDFPSFSPDSLALLLLTLVRTKNQDLASEHKAFLQSQVDVFAKKVIDPKTLTPYPKSFSSIRDHAKRKGACYDAVMACVVAREAPALGLSFPYGYDAMRQAFLSAYWNGTYFFSDLQKQAIVIGDAQVYPFWCDIVDDEQMLRECLDATKAAGLDSPFPLRYVSTFDKRKEKVSLHFADLFAKDYETDSIWAHLGLCYIEVLARIDPLAAKKHLETYTKNLLTYRTFLEVYDADGTPFMRPFYASDEGMSWCAQYLWLKNGLNGRGRI